MRLLVLDVDGVLTDGRIVYSDGEEVQRFHVQDGAAIGWLKGAGVFVAWITGRGCRATERRADELKVDRLVTHAGPKAAALAKLQEFWDISPDETVSMGDDLPDLGLRRRSAFFATPSNGRPELKEAADLITHAAGGEGAVRELAEHILRAKGLWQGIVDAAGQ